MMSIVFAALECKVYNCIHCDRFGVKHMRAVTIRNVPEEVHRAIRVRAARNGRTLQAEMCDILATAVKPESRVRLGDLLAGIGRKVKLTEEEMKVFDRGHSPARAANFE